MRASNQIQSDFGARVRALRKQRGLSQEDFAFECRLDRTYISQVEQGRRNIGIQNIATMAAALGVSIAELFSQRAQTSADQDLTELTYCVDDHFSVDCGFAVSGNDILASVIDTAKQLRLLPFALYQSIDLKTLSSIVGAVFSSCLANRVNAIVNPIEKGHPDIIPESGRYATEAQLRNFPQGLEVKVTVGNVTKGSDLKPGIPRVKQLTGVTWQAHHREVKCLLGLIIDFAGASIDGKHYPVITGVFHADDLVVADWGEISGTTGRNTKVTGLRSCGKCKMGRGWVLLFNREDYITKYSKFLNFIME